jgi:hypothetical protein
MPEMRVSNVLVTPLHAHYRPAHVQHVVAEMLQRGPPRIRAYYDVHTDVWFTLEGTHRLRAALQLGVAPVLVLVTWPRSARALVRARYAVGRSHVFPRVEVVGPA